LSNITSSCVAAAADEPEPEVEAGVEVDLFAAGVEVVLFAAGVGVVLVAAAGAEVDFAGVEACAGRVTGVA
jgi:hypothetical protein